MVDYLLITKAFSQGTLTCIKVSLQVSTLKFFSYTTNKFDRKKTNKKFTFMSSIVEIHSTQWLSFIINLW